jgi:hypothetical protein
MTAANKAKAKSYFKDKFFNLLTTILVGVLAFIANEYFQLNKQIFEKLSEVSTALSKEVEEVKDEQAADHQLILENKTDIAENNKKDCAQDEILSRHEKEIDKLKYQ